METCSEILNGEYHSLIQSMGGSFERDIPLSDDSQSKSWRIMIRDATLVFDGIDEPMACDDLFTLETPHSYETLNSLEAIADTRELTLSFLGDTFPKMKKLRLSNSIIPSVRDIGCTFVHLRFLSLARCNLRSLDGIATISRNLEELYLAFNHITDLVDLMGMDRLGILDLEENEITEIESIEVLKLCAGLRALTLNGNPAANIPDYVDRVRILLPQLGYLDEQRIAPPRRRLGLPASSSVDFEMPVVPPLVIRQDRDVVTELVDDLVADRPPSARGNVRFARMAAKQKMVQKLTSPAPKIFRPLSARVKPA
jgi:hypothetical protein